MERPRCSDDDDLEEHAKNQLRNAWDNVALDAIGGRFVYSNREGFRVLEGLRDLQHDMKTSVTNMNKIRNPEEGDGKVENRG